MKYRMWVKHHFLLTFLMWKNGSKKCKTDQSIPLWMTAAGDYHEWPQLFLKCICITWFFTWFFYASLTSIWLSSRSGMNGLIHNKALILTGLHQGTTTWKGSKVACTYTCTVTVYVQSSNDMSFFLRKHDYQINGRIFNGNYWKQYFYMKTLQLS